MAELQGKKALVTGGSRGIGAAIARQLAAEGADVAITYGSSQAAAEAVVAELQQQGVKALAIQADANQSEQVGAAVQEAIAQLQGLDILVNNAGPFGLKPITEATLADYDQMMNINVRSVFPAIHEAAPGPPSTLMGG